MNIIKVIKDYIIKKTLPKGTIPRGLFELDQYFRQYKQIEFEFKVKKDLIIAVSKDFRYGSIVTSGKNHKELEENIKDAILTSFCIPSSYSKEVVIKKVGEADQSYALA
ncbi:MAG: hypothetical protein ISS02_02630 [Candidatus Portnoybacteria bacterium]|nr:hypothetical protein [Candidatus Portnoybacteria bacterium]